MAGYCSERKEREKDNFAVSTQLWWRPLAARLLRSAERPAGTADRTRCW